MIKKLLLICALLFSASAYSADKEVTILLYGPPGGATDTLSTVLKGFLEKSGYRVNYTFYKTCAEAIQHARRKDSNTIFANNSSDYNPGNNNARCVFDPTSMTDSNFKIMSVLGVANKFLCFSPKNKDLTLNDLVSGKQYTMGIVADDQDPLLIQYLINNSKMNLKIVKYKGGGEMRTAAQVGDIDMTFPGGTVGHMLDMGSKCVASLAKANPLNVPFLGDYMTPKNSNEFGIMAMWWKTGPIDDNILKIIKAGIVSNEYQDYAAKMKFVVPTWSSDESYEKLVNVNSYRNKVLNGTVK